jgi:hypothetical protein
MTVTNETGSYALPNLPLGPYRLEATLPGFRTFVQTGIVLQVNNNVAINVVLEVGQVTEQVEVQANASLVETRSASVGQVMETARIVELPLNGRNAQELLLLGGGTVQQAPIGGSAFPGRLMISSAGTRGPATDYTLDGIRHVDPWDGLVMPLPFPDALAEFKTESSGVGSNTARAAAVSVVTKSGTNEFHGDLFEFVRNDLFNARPYFAAKGSSLKRNQYGGTVGGPILKNKLFFFGGYQGTVLRQDPADTRSFIPTAAMMAGDFTAIASPECNAGRTVPLRSPFVGTRIDPGLFSPAAVKLVSRLPKTDSPCGEIRYGARSNNNQYQVLARGDYQWTANHSLFARFMRSTDDSPSPFKYTPDNILNASNSTEAFANAIVLGSTYLISPTTVHAFRMSYSGDVQTRIAPSFFEAKDLGINVFSNVGKVMNVQVTSAFAVGSSTIGPGHFRSHLYQISDDLSMTRGRHQFSIGAHLAHSRTDHQSSSQSSGSFTFGSTNTGLSMGDFLIGKPANFEEGVGGRSFSRVNYIGLYGSDAWQMTPRLTVSSGVRWSPILPIMDYRRPVPEVWNFDMNRYLQGQRSSVFVNAPPGFLYPGDPGLANENNGSNAAKPKADVFNAHWGLFSPRLGLAWDVKGDGRMSVRASYGLSYEDYPTQYRLGTQSEQAPWGFRTLLTSPAGGFEDPWRGVTGGNPFPIQFRTDMPWVPLGTYQPTVANITPTYTQSWNLSIQRQVMTDTLVSVSYLGSQITHLQAGNPLNMPIYIPGNADASGNCFLNGKAVYFKVTAGSACSTVANTDARRTLALQKPEFANEIGILGDIVYGGTQNYHGAVLSLQRRPTRGVNLSANYTLSHCIGDYAARLSQSASPDMSYQDPNNRRRDRANCEYDQRHSFNITGVAQTPNFGNRTLTLLASGWRLSGIYRRSTAGTINATNVGSGARTVIIDNDAVTNVPPGSTDPCRCNLRGQRPDLVLASPYLDKSGRPGTQYLNPVAFALPAVGTLGNLGRVNIQLPTSWQFDLALARVFRIRESQSMEFRAEAYNVTNSFRSDKIDMFIRSANFGKIRNALDPRILQFALKYVF